MKKIASISLLALLLYNAFGYYALLAYQKEQAKIMTVSETPKTAFKIINIPVSAYVHLEDTDFEYTDGQFEYEGEIFNIVKQRRVNDTLQIYALHNERQDKAAAQFNNYVKDFLTGNNTPIEHSPTKQLLKTFLKDYIGHPTYIVSAPESSLQGATLPVIGKADKLSSCALVLHSPPPEVA